MPYKSDGIDTASVRDSVLNGVRPSDPIVCIVDLPLLPIPFSCLSIILHVELDDSMDSCLAFSATPWNVVLLIVAGRDSYSTLTLDDERGDHVTGHRGDVE